MSESIIDSRYQAWLSDGRIHAEVMLSCGASYADAIAALRFFYGRKRLELARGSYREMAMDTGVAIDTARQLCRRYPKGKLTYDALRQAALWSGGMAIHRVQYRYAIFVWTRCLLLTAITRAKGNRLQASRLLKVHRNTMWRIPDSPEKTRRAPNFRTAKGAA